MIDNAGDDGGASFWEPQFKQSPNVALCYVARAIQHSAFCYGTHYAPDIPVGGHRSTSQFQPIRQVR